MLLAVALCSRKNMNVYGGLYRCRSGEEVVPALTLDLEVVAAWFYSPARVYFKPFWWLQYTAFAQGISASIFLEHATKRPKFVLGLSMAAAERGFTGAEVFLPGAEAVK